MRRKFVELKNSHLSEIEPFDCLDDAKDSPVPTKGGR